MKMAMTLKVRRVAVSSAAVAKAKAAGNRGSRMKHHLWIRKYKELRRKALMDMESSRQGPKALRSSKLFSKACGEVKGTTHMGMMNRMRKKRMTLKSGVSPVICQAGRN